MKKLTILPVFLCLAGFGMAQNQSNSPETIVVPPNETVQHCTSMIQAIDKKVEHVMADESDRLHAEQTGWFEKMAHNRAVFVARREYLINQPQPSQK